MGCRRVSLWRIPRMSSERQLNQSESVMATRSFIPPMKRIVCHKCKSRNHASLSPHGARYYRCPEGGTNHSEGTIQGGDLCYIYSAQESDARCAGEQWSGRGSCAWEHGLPKRCAVSGGRADGAGDSDIGFARAELQGAIGRETGAGSSGAGRVSLCMEGGAVGLGARNARGPGRRCGL